MLKMIPNAFEVVRTTLGKIKEVRQPASNFILHVLPLWLSMNCRMGLMNMQRWGGRSEKSYRAMFAKTFDWFGFNAELLKANFKGTVIAVFDPAYIKKRSNHRAGRRNKSCHFCYGGGRLLYEKGLY